MKIDRAETLRYLRMGGVEPDAPLARRLARVEDDVRVLASVDGHIVAARQGNQLVTAFHPELDSDLHIHKYFLSMIAA